ncbi:hypothetical protein ELI_3268 [Eubacterium callanderi]|uniref:Uncharacterized protein n=1 Tax=Eubacterium callanderi TaxID=53442 RepID=E3GF98_9FIRM|nr:hypothetical protein ELI_3268 [Eubacterium callanderi]
MNKTKGNVEHNMLLCYDTKKEAIP